MVQLRANGYISIGFTLFKNMLTV